MFAVRDFGVLQDRLAWLRASPGPPDTVGRLVSMWARLRTLGAVLGVSLSLLGCSGDSLEGVWVIKGPSAGSLQFVRLELREGGTFVCNAVFTEGGLREQVTGTWSFHRQRDVQVLELRVGTTGSPRLFGGRTSVLTEVCREGDHLILPRGFAGEGLLTLQPVSGR